MRQKKFKLGVAEVLHLRRVWTAVWAAGDPKLKELNTSYRPYFSGRARKDPQKSGALCARHVRPPPEQFGGNAESTLDWPPRNVRRIVSSRAKCVGRRHDRDRCREAGACRGIVVSGVTRTRPGVKPASLVIVLHGNTRTREIEASRRVRLTLTRPALRALARKHMSR